VWRFSWCSQTTTAITQDYMKTKQVDVTPAMRAILVDWLVEVAEEYKLTTDTLFVCVRVLRFHVRFRPTCC
jgi:cyclin-A